MYTVYRACVNQVGLFKLANFCNLQHAETFKNHVRSMCPTYKYFVASEEDVITFLEENLGKFEEHLQERK